VVHLLKIPFGILAPIILMLATIGAYAVRNSMLDVWAMFVAGFVGFLMRKSGYSMAGLVLGVILGKVGEGALVKAMPMVRYDIINLMQRPICFILIVSAIVLLGMSIRRSIRESRRDGPVTQ
jgi:putative tricarboxylic transport membrane protein